MNSALTPREIQARLRAGATVADVAAAAGVEVVDIDAFAGPVLAEREFMASSALSATVRRRGEGSSHHRLGEIVRERLQQRGIDADDIRWDAWRQEDLRWRVVGVQTDDAGTRTAEFVFDHKARFSVAHNTDGRWMIGDRAPGAPEEEESTVDLDDELALLRATSERRPVADAPGDDVPGAATMHGAFEDTSELDALYDLLSGVSEDSVRIYTGLDDDAPAKPKAKREPKAQSEPEQPEPDPKPEPAQKPKTAPENSEPIQDSLVEDEGTPPAPQPKPKPRRRGRAHVPSWDEIMFGGPTK
ncbi:MAG: DUF3071 domain-containing protein [Propionibacterium sp.]|nr:DUF3071 domain-containing protein [Propionibacterium sp.]